MALRVADCALTFRSFSSFSASCATMDAAQLAALALAASTQVAAPSLPPPAVIVPRAEFCCRRCSHHLVSSPGHTCARKASNRVVCWVCAKAKKPCEDTVSDTHGPGAVLTRCRSLGH